MPRTLLSHDKPARGARRLALVATTGAVVALSGCSAFVSTTNTTADALHTVSHGVSVSSRSSTNVSSGEAEQARAAQTRAYVANQRAALQREAAFGGGEHIRTLATLIDDDQPAGLSRWMQSHYNSLFAPGQSTDDIVAALQQRAG